jgi:hypothetical protein
MNSVFVMTGTVTYALRAKNILNDEGYKAEVVKASALDKKYGCGYGVRLRADDTSHISKILSNSGIKVLGIRVNE